LLGFFGDRKAVGGQEQGARVNQVFGDADALIGLNADLV
jgi:hypothetical protein